MESDIRVRELAPLPEGLYEVSVAEGADTTIHRVHIDPAFLAELGLEAEQEGTPVHTGAIVSLLRRSFEFLLRREPKESILGEFDLRDIQRYFPEYPGNMP